MKQSYIIQENGYGAHTIEKNIMLEERSNKIDKSIGRITIKLIRIPLTFLLKAKSSEICETIPLPVIC